VSKPKHVSRDVFSELVEGIVAMKEHRLGKATLRTHRLPAAYVKEAPGAEYFVAVRERFNVSRPVWANMLRVSPRTVEKWEQGGQASPLAATFVELVATYPDTIERLQSLPRRVARSASGTASRGHSAEAFNDGSTLSTMSSTEQLRKRYRPKRIRVLFVGEAPPAGGTFFYRENSQVYRYLHESLQLHIRGDQGFLTAFRERGYFLDDLVAQPVDDIPLKDREAVFRQSVPHLAERLAQYQPEVVITILKRISGYVEEAMSLAALDVPHYAVPFPGNGQQTNFRHEMAAILPNLP
jgi:putative transcriptional regulator